MKKVYRYVLGLDVGTNSVGWALVKLELQPDGRFRPVGIIDDSSRIIPLTADVLSDFSRGITKSPAAERTLRRGIRRRYERKNLRRERLNRVLRLLGYLPEHYAKGLNRYGQLKKGQEPLLAWCKDACGQSRFLFMDSYQEMLELFRQHQPELVREGLKVPYDWTVYYLRQKALTKPLSNQELAWLLLYCNQKRACNLVRGQAQEGPQKQEEYKMLTVVEVNDTGKKDKKGLTVWSLRFDNDMSMERAARTMPNCLGQKVNVVITTTLDEEGFAKTDKYGVPKRTFRMPKEDDWGLIRLKTEQDIAKSGLTVGAYIFQALLINPKEKIRGKLIQTVERDLYEDELHRIMQAQVAFHPEWQDADLYERCLNALYPNNVNFRNSLLEWKVGTAEKMVSLLVDNILLYQRDLKSKKSSIRPCSFEVYQFTDPEGKMVSRPVKCIPKSHPLFQEFRLWQWIGNLRIYRSEGIGDDVDITAEVLPDEAAKVALFDHLSTVSSITENGLLQYLKLKNINGAEYQYRWNYVQDKSYPCNVFRGTIGKALDKALKRAESSAELKTAVEKDKEILFGYRSRLDTKHYRSVEERLWHILYTVNDMKDLAVAVRNFANTYGLSDLFVSAISALDVLEEGYGSLSERAIRKLLSLMRMGHHWRLEAIDAHTQGRIQKIIDGEVDETISERTRNLAAGITSLDHCHGLPYNLACYLVYDRFSELGEAVKWRSPLDMDAYIRSFKHNSLNNPIVEEVVLETLRTVRDIWSYFGQIDEIHIEMGRDLKNSPKKRKEMTDQIALNEAANFRIRTQLTALLNDVYIGGDEKDSPVESDIDLIKRKLEGLAILKHPTQSQIERYKLWLDQKMQSPYTGEFIPLSRLLTDDYQVDHILPQALIIDDSLSNRVVVEAAVNHEKSCLLAAQYFKEHGGEVVQLGKKKSVPLFTYNGFKDHVLKTWGKDSLKRKKLLMEELTPEFVSRQLNDTRYISKFLLSVLSNVVREEGELESTSKNVLPCVGMVTDVLKRDWGVNDVWNRIILPRFKRMNEKEHTSAYTKINSRGHEVPAVPLELSKGFNMKRIDHRHHAMDAIVIACTTRQHMNLLNTENAAEAPYEFKQLSRKMRTSERKFKLPWPTFPADLQKALENTVVSFKQDLRVVTKSSNYYTKYVEVEKDGKKVMVKKQVPQVSENHWAVRKSLHKETYLGLINIQSISTVRLSKALLNPDRIVGRDLKVKIKELLAMGYNERKIKAYFAKEKEIWSDFDPTKIKYLTFSSDKRETLFSTRMKLDSSVTYEFIEKKIADTAIKSILRNHLDNYHGDSVAAFSPEGIEELNRNLVNLNNGRFHQPIYKISWYEKATKFPVGAVGCKSKQFVESATGTNLFFAVSENSDIDSKTGSILKNRSFTTLSFREVLERSKQLAVLDDKALFLLSPNDLVYVPTAEDLKQGRISKPLDLSRVYRVVSFAKYQLYCIPANVASPIKMGSEFSQGNKMEKAITGEMIKSICVPLSVNRLGEIKLR